ncbi:MAG: CPBP family intramembrane metalloprotease, partial [Thermoproteus sp.]|nr:CPBP family intramembrane metalloprotease [Thermoproteus sp.]
PKWSPRGFANALLLFMLWLFAQPLLGLLPVQSSSDVAAEIAELYREGLLPTLIVLSIAVEPIVHEVMFRGVLFEELSRLGRAPAYLISSLAYALLLAPPLSPQLAVAAADTFLMGLILAYAYKNGGLSASILLHSIYSIIYVIYILSLLF